MEILILSVILVAVPVLLIIGLVSISKALAPKRRVDFVIGGQAYHAKMDARLAGNALETALRKKLIAVKGWSGHREYGQIDIVEPYLNR